MLVPSLLLPPLTAVLLFALALFLLLLSQLDLDLLLVILPCVDPNSVDLIPIG